MINIIIDIAIIIILTTTTHYYHNYHYPQHHHGRTRDARPSRRNHPGLTGARRGGRGQNGWISSAEKSEAGEIAKTFPPLNTPLRKSLRNPQTGELQRPDSVLGILAEECRKYAL